MASSTGITNFRSCEGLSDACRGWACAANSLGRRPRSLREGNRGGIRRGGAGGSVYGDLTAARWLAGVAWSAGSRGSGRPRHRRAGPLANVHFVAKSARRPGLPAPPGGRGARRRRRVVPARRLSGVRRGRAVRGGGKRSMSGPRAPPAGRLQTCRDRCAKFGRRSSAVAWKTARNGGAAPHG